MRDVRGLPIAAYLGALVALALTAAFVATLAIVIFLPPRPPDVMRADKITDHFEAGYDYMLAAGRPMNEDGVTWVVRDEPPRETSSVHVRPTTAELAMALELRPDQVRLYAQHIERSETFVFRVANMDELTREAERAAADAERIRIEMENADFTHEHEAKAAAERAEAAQEEAEYRAEAIQRAIERAQDAAERAEEARARAAERIAEQRALAAERMAERRQEAIERHAAEVERYAEEAVRRAQRGEHVTHIEIPEPPDVLVEAPAPDVMIAVAPEAPAAPVAPAPPSARSRSATAPTPVAPPAPPTPIFAPAPDGVVLLSGFQVGAQLPDGRWLVMTQGRNWAEIGWIARAAGVIGGTLLVLTLLAALFARRLTRPIRNFSNAVQAVGVDPQSEPVKEEGPQELRGAARAVNTMQARLRALIADRTKTLAAVAHDMRTPLMRLRLAAENAPVEQRERMAKEIGEVEALVASFIAFARDDPAEEARVRLDLSSLLESIANDQCEAGRDVTFSGEDRLIITGQSLGLKRLFGNLVENALKYGERARITLSRDDAHVLVDVADDGPGIPPEKRESVFEPFVRLNEEGTRGAGLGLAAAQSIARAHGGEIVILDAERGALLRVTLPL
ncbi:ATP-binding protein [Vitreimonas sp.]|uniref:ATP-binding protein n=1 Tax=Vitreimonas sp. TaxID=3069702 RepID=UPI002ED88A33